MNAEMNEGMNEDYTAETQVFDDESSFDAGNYDETVDSHHETSTEPVAEPVDKPSEIVPIDRQRAEQQAQQAREALAKFYEPQSQAPSVEGEGSAPDPREDIIGYMGWMGKKLQEQDAYIRAQQDAQRQAVEYQEFNGHLNQFLESSVTSIKDKYSDFDAAADFLYETRAKQLNAWSSVYPI